MKLIHNKHTWKGTFTYDEGYDDADQYIVVDFYMELIFSGESFTGTSTDSESKDLFNEPAEVRGFIDEEKISFVLNYPCHYYQDDNGQIVLDKQSKHPEIHYLAFWDDESKTTACGTWEMKTYEEKFGDGYLEEIASGTFEMRRTFR